MRFTIGAMVLITDQVYTSEGNLVRSYDPKHTETRFDNDSFGRAIERRPNGRSTLRVERVADGRFRFREPSGN